MADNKINIKEEHTIAEQQEEQGSYTTDAGTTGSRSSSTSSRNMEKIGQDESYTIVDEDAESTGAAEAYMVDEDAESTSADGTGKYADLMDEEEIAEEGLVTNEAARRDGVTSDEDADEVAIVMGTEADITEEDLVLLGDPDQDADGGDDEDFNRVSLDQVDEDDDPLNESSVTMSATGDDLDMPDEDDQGSDDLGNEDEENKYYSLGSDDNDGLNEGTP